MALKFSININRQISLLLIPVYAYLKKISFTKAWAPLFFVSSYFVDLIILFLRDDALLGILHASQTDYVFKQQQNLGQ